MSCLRCFLDCSEPSTTHWLWHLRNVGKRCWELTGHCDSGGSFERCLSCFWSLYKSLWLQRVQIWSTFSSDSKKQRHGLRFHQRKQKTMTLKFRFLKVNFSCTHTPSRVPKTHTSSTFFYTPPECPATLSPKRIRPITRTSIKALCVFLHMAFTDPIASSSWYAWYVLALICVVNMLRQISWYALALKDTKSTIATKQNISK